jgi:hypothetical protein
MQLTVERRSFLSGEHRNLGWIEIPSTAPAHIHTRIVEWRHANFDRAVKPVSRLAKPASRPVAATALASESEREAMQLRIRAAQIAFLQ